MVRYKRFRILGDPGSGEIYPLKRKPESTRTYTIADLSREIEAKSTLTEGDISHTIEELVKHLRKKLVEGDKVKISGLGTFFTTFNTIPAEEEKDCNVRNIRRVNIRFMVDNSLRLVNASHALTDSENNVNFELCKCADRQGTSDSDTPGPGTPGNGDDNGDNPLD
ncbi:MAG: HU family DNA-binding protein [Bacteroides sp.]|nr:HU family DNA-binding protein [Bacteroides sp.]